MVRILGIAGSLRGASYSQAVLDLALKHAAGHGIEVGSINLRQLSLPFCDGESDYKNYPDVERLRKAVAEAQALIIVTPEYHGSISGVLKNALDLLEFAHMEGTIVGSMSILGGTHSMNALNTLRVVCRQLHAWVIPQQVMIASAAEAFDSNGQLIDPVNQERVKLLVDSLVDATQRLHGPKG